MTPDHFSACLNVLNWTQRGLAALLDRNERTVRRWASGQQDIPADVTAWLDTLTRFHQQHPPPARQPR